MKELTLILATLILSGSVFAQNTLPFSKGVNMPMFFENWNKGRILPDLNRYTEADFVCLKSMGVDIIRLPINCDVLTDEEFGAGTIHEPVLKKLDEVCDWAERNQIYLIIDNHNNQTFDKPSYTSNDFILLQKQLESAWTQIAQRYADRSDYIIYEIMNEPAGKNADKWYKIQQGIINLIRRYDASRKIIVSGVNWSNITELTQLKPYKDENLIYTFHFYEPWGFLTDGSGPLSDIGEIPFPYDEKRFPKLPDNLSWIKDQCRKEGNIKHINSRIKKAADWAKKNNVTLLCGEFGTKIWTNPKDRAAWNKAVTSAFRENNIPYCVWGVIECNGLVQTKIRSIEYLGYLDFPDDIDAYIAESYGFSMPTSEAVAKIKAGYDDFPKKPYVVYDGIGGTRSRMGIWNVNEKKVSDSHEYCLVMSYPQKYGNSGVNLPKIIASKFEENVDSLVVCLDVKFTDKSQSFEVLLQDSDFGRKELPWSKHYELKAADYALNEWVTVEIPVSSFQENRGVYSDVDQKWYDLPCEFTWSRFQKVFLDFNDHNDSKKGDVFVDNIIIKMK